MTPNPITQSYRRNGRYTGHGKYLLAINLPQKRSSLAPAKRCYSIQYGPKQTAAILLFPLTAKGGYYNHNKAVRPMTSSLGSIIQQILPQITPATGVVLDQMAQPMSPTLDSLINQLISLKPSGGDSIANIVKSGVIEATVLSSSLLAKPGTGPTMSATPTAPLPETTNQGSAQFKIIINTAKQTLTLITPSPIPVGSHIKLNVTPHSAAATLTILGSDKINIQLPATLIGETVASKLNPNTAIDKPQLPPTFIPPMSKAGIDRATIEQGVRTALPLQQPLKSLLPLIQAISQQASPKLPQNLIQNLNVLMRQFPSAEQLQQPETLKRAISNSGSFFEAKLAQLAASNTSATSPSTNKDVLLDVKGLLQRILRQVDKAANPGKETLPASNLLQALPSFNLDLQNRSGKTQGSKDQSVDILLRQLGSQLLASVARTQINQLETLAHRQQNTPDNQGPINSWTLEIPIMQGKHVDNMEMRIDQQLVDEDTAQGKDKAKKLWTVMLAFDLHTLGKMNVQLKILDQSVSAKVWSQLEHTHQTVKQQIQGLKGNLEKVGVNVKQVECQLGLPAKSQIPIYNQLVDIRT